MLWPDNYFPQNFEQFIGNVEIVEHAVKWAEEWDKGGKGKPLLFFGNTGTGKTCLAILLAQHFGWELFELNASDFRTKDVIERLVGAASQGASFSGKRRLILLDEVDGLQARDRGGAAAIVKILKESNNPVILTANDIYSNQKLLPIREQCELRQFKKINYLSIAKRLRAILESEKISFDPEAIKLLARNCGGDFRSALLDTQALSFSGPISFSNVEQLGYRERQENVFNVLDKIFKGKTVGEVRKARFQSEVSDDLLFRWVEENIPRVYSDIGDTARAFDVLSRADIFEGRIMRRQHYGFKRYSSELFTSGVALSKQNEYHGWLKLQFPQLLKNLRASSARRNLKKELTRKIGLKTHSSSKKVSTEDLPFMKLIFQDKTLAPKIAAEFELNEKEIAFILETKPSAKKVQNIFEESQKIKQEVMIAKRKPLEAISTPLPKVDEPVEVKEEPDPEESQKQTTLF
ncbi:MAG: hypothetical protein CL943_01080 [Candidatus Diapherotrites archaeon]|uniref:Replication factor C large subunit n=1 Tax=Candidatus Iainarchaeum sp. TaxID=3101447 RepID=A0A2D6M0C7_9ARCH|nr:hypothetical protein [Candidatus Diapherotrites archaeon]|tara:strand:+ start:821 stop:2209 length:1389 start_codon:yes stop_codon:yes gene_type:complete